MIRRYVFAFAALIALPPLASAQETSPQSKVKSAPKVCRTYDMSGSRIATRVCKTQAQWDEDDRVNDVSNGDFETRGNRVATGRNINTGTGGTGPGTGAPN